jgi:hypothetical protein
VFEFVARLLQHDLDGRVSGFSSEHRIGNDLGVFPRGEALVVNQRLQ